MQSRIICLLVLLPLFLQAVVSIDICPDFSATFVGVSDQVLHAEILITDPELTFFKEVIGLRDEDIQHTFENGFKFFNDTYGLDFSLSTPNGVNEYVFEKARLNLVRFHEAFRYSLVLSNWITTRNPGVKCSDIQDGGFRVSFIGDQILHGSYGGVAGIHVGTNEALIYGLSRINVCKQSPVLLQIQTATPFRQEAVDGAMFVNFDIYNAVLGSGKAYTQTRS